MGARMTEDVAEQTCRSEHAGRNTDMTPRDVLFRALNGEETESAPVWLLFPYHATGYYVDVRAHEQYRAVFEHCLKKDVIMLNRRSLGIPLHASAVESSAEEISKAGDVFHRQTFRFEGKAIVADPASGKKLLASEEDLLTFCGFPLEADETVLTDALEAQLPKYMREKSEFPEDRGAMMLDLGSPVNTIYHSAALDEYPIWSITQSEAIEAWLENRMRQLEFLYRFCLERELADVYFLVGSELASPPMLSRETFRRWVVPYEKRLIEMIHSYGKKAIQHYHGQIKEILPDFVEMAPDALHTIEAPPVGNCTLAEAFDITQNTITLIGNIQYDEFRSSTPSEMKARVRDVLNEVAGRRFILSPSAGPFDANPPDALIDNYIAFIDAAM